MPTDSAIEKLASYPRFRVVPSQEYKAWLVVTCVRDDCPSEGTSFLVKKANWVRSEYRTRPCPYCFKVSTHPMLLKGGKDEERPRRGRAQRRQG